MSSPSRFLQRRARKLRSGESVEETPTSTLSYGNDSPNFLARSRQAKYQIGQVVKHRVFPFRGVIFDVDPEFANTEDWWNSIPAEVRPRKDQPFYHLLAENAETTYVAYVSEQNLVSDESGEPIGHPQVTELFTELRDGRYVRREPLV